VSESSDPQPRTKKEPASGFSPTPGCLILLCVLLTFIGLVTWAGITFVRQNRQIDAFTASAPVDITPQDITEAERDAVLDKLQAFRDSVAAKTAAEFSLNLEELNALLSLERFSDNKVSTVLQVVRIDDDAIHAKISFPLNSFPPGTFRYLNGTLLADPVINKKAGLVLNTKDIQVPGKTVAAGFLQRYQQDGYLDQMLIEPFRDEDKGTEIADVLKAIDSVKIENGSIVIGYTPVPPGK
jgi:hypothetical protein